MTATNGGLSIRSTAQINTTDAAMARPVDPADADAPSGVSTVSLTMWCPDSTRRTPCGSVKYQDTGL